jgi:hypothetical protein
MRALLGRPAGTQLVPDAAALPGGVPEPLAEVEAALDQVCQLHGLE